MRLKEDSNSRKSRSIKRRDFRHDPGTPDTEAPKHKSKKRRKHIKGCEHRDVVRVVSRKYYSGSKCKICGKRLWVWHSPTPIASWRKPIDPTKALEGSTWVIIERKSGD